MMALILADACHRGRASFAAICDGKRLGGMGCNATRCASLVAGVL